MSSGHLYATLSNSLDDFLYSDWLATWQSLFLAQLHSYLSLSSPSLSLGILRWWSLSTQFMEGLTYIRGVLGSSGRSAHIHPFWPAPPALLTHSCCFQVHWMFPPPPLMPSKLLQVSEMLWDACRCPSEYLFPCPQNKPPHWPLISDSRPTKCLVTL
jgi:hypothetical protein